jgi:hypothetical protein
MQWSNVTDRQVAVFTADQKEKVRGGAALFPQPYWFWRPRTDLMHPNFPVRRREWHCNLNIFHGGQHYEPITRSQEDDGLPDLP